MDSQKQTSGDLTCRVCGKSFQNEALLEKHLETAHDDVLAPSEQTASPICPRCGSPFGTLEQLREHSRSAHSE